MLLMELFQILIAIIWLKCAICLSDEHHIELKIFKVKNDGLESCSNFCLNGANGQTILKSKCIDTFIESTQYSCDYKRNPNSMKNINSLPLIICHCEEPLQYELKFTENQKRFEQPPNDKIINLIAYNYQYTTLDFIDYKSELVIDGQSSCQNEYMSLPTGWEIAPADKITLSIIEQYSFSGAHYIILSDFNAYLSKLGRFEAFKRAKDNTLWKEIEGRIIDGDNINIESNTDLSLEKCKQLCVSDILCKSIQFPHCELKKSTNTNKLDESYQFSTYIKLNMDTSVGIELKGNPDGLFIKYYSNKFGLYVPSIYCPGRILLRKIRNPLQCDINGHWYELIYSEKVTYDIAKQSNSLYWHGIKGHLAIITSSQENMCIQSLICNINTEEEENNIAWIGAERIGNEYKWMVNNTDEYNEIFIDSTQNIKLGMYAPELKNWNVYNNILKTTSNSPNEFYAITICNNNLNSWNIENKNNKHYFIIEYELPLRCDEIDTVFEILGPPMQYYYAEEIASKQLWFGNNGYLGNILNEKEEKCIERFEFCGFEKIWAAGEDNYNNNRPHEWLWKSIYGPINEMEKLFYIKNRPNDKKLNLYSNWNIKYDEPDNLLGKQHHLAICGMNKKWSDENYHLRLKYLIKYKQMKPLNAPRILKLIGLNGGIKLSFSEPLNDGGSKIINCRIAIHPLKIEDVNSRYYQLNLIAYSLYKDIIPNVEHFQVQHVYFNAMNGIEYETELQCANKYGLSPSGNILRVTPIGPPEKPQKIWIIKQNEESVIIGWKRSFSDGGSEIINYYIRGIAIGRRGANCEKQCNQQFNQIKPPYDYTKLRSEYWDLYFDGKLQKNKSNLNDKITSELQQFVDELTDINKDEENDIINDKKNNITKFVDLNETLTLLTKNTNINCVDIGFAKFIEPENKNKKQNAICIPFCWFIQKLKCKYIIYRGYNKTDIILKGYINDDEIIDPNSINIGKYISINNEHNIERIEWTEWIEWISQPKIHYMFTYDTSALDMLRIWGSWDDFSQGIPLHLTPKNNGFITWIGLHSGLYHYYFEGARQENGRPYFFTFIDDTQPITSIWKEILNEFRDENIIRVQTRNVILQPYKKININLVNNGNSKQEYFQYEISGMTLFQQYKFEIWAENAVGEGPSIITNSSIHFTTPQIKKQAEMLKHFFHATNGALWSKSWDMRDEYICGQYGVFCTNGLVDRIHLIGNNLQGTIPNSMGDILTNLQILELSDNKLSSTIPKSFNNLKQIQILRLANNELEGSIPESIWSYPLMEYLDLGGNAFRGSIPDSIGQLVNIHSVRLHNNKFAGTLPSSMSQLKLLQHLILFGNLFHGTVPSWISLLQRLTHLDLGNNEFTGSIPIHLSNLKSLQSLLLNDNYISGKLEDNLSVLTKLKYLSVKNNKLEGSIPTSWHDRSKIFPNLKSLELSDNVWACPIPNYSKWAHITDYKNILSLTGGRCACLVSLWSKWCECHDSFGPGSVKIQTRERKILVEAENGGQCYPLEEYRDCRIKPNSYFNNNSIPNITVCISANPDNFGIDIDLTIFTTKVEIDTFIITYKSGSLSCNKNQEWSHSKFGCNLCQPWQPLRFYQPIKNKCGSNINIKNHILVQNIEECAIQCHHTSKCLSFEIKDINSKYGNFDCALKDNQQIIEASNCKTYDFKTTSYYVLNTNNDNVRLINDELIAFNGRLQVLNKSDNMSLSNLTWGAVLSKGFNYNAANVLCQSIGYNQIVKDIIIINSESINDPNLKLYTNTLNNSEEYIWIKEFNCNGNELSLWECNNTFTTELHKFDINKHETIAVICQPNVPFCSPFSVFITEQNTNQIEPNIIAPYFDASNNGYEYIGCFEIGKQMNIKHWFELNEYMTPYQCYLKCVSEIRNNKSIIFYDVFVIRNGGYCGCGNEFGKYGIIENSKCNVKCLGDLELMLCGGLNAYSAFEIEYFNKMMLQSKDVNEYEYYFPKFKIDKQSMDNNVLILPTQRGFIVDPSATYKIWYGENLRRVNIENNIGETCTSLTVDIHKHPLSWLENEKSNIIDDNVEQLDYNQLFL